MENEHEKACDNVSLKKGESKISCHQYLALDNHLNGVMQHNTFKLVYSLTDFLLPHLRRLTHHLMRAFYSFLGLAMPAKYSHFTLTEISISK